MKSDVITIDIANMPQTVKMLHDFLSLADDLRQGNTAVSAEKLAVCIEDIIAAWTERTGEVKK